MCISYMCHPALQLCCSSLSDLHREPPSVLGLAVFHARNAGRTCQLLRDAFHNHLSTRNALTTGELKSRALQLHMELFDRLRELQEGAKHAEKLARMSSAHLSTSRGQVPRWLWALGMSLHAVSSIILAFEKTNVPQKNIPAALFPLSWSWCLLSGLVLVVLHGE